MIKTSISDHFNIFGALCITTLLLCSCSNSSTEPRLTDQQVNDVSQRALKNLVFIEGGTFLLGDVGVMNGRPYTTYASDNNKPPVEVTLDSYSISKYETTWGDFTVYIRDVGRAEDYTLEAGFTAARGLPISSNRDPLSPNYFRKPARSPSYQEAAGYCQWLANHTGVPFALPTEAQWEYAARNRGQDVPYATDDGTMRNDTYLQRPDEYVDPAIPPSGNALSHSSLKKERRPVGSYPSSPIGLYDMTGNVPEWTQDWYDKNAYQHINPHNPSGPAKPVNPDKPEKVVRDWAGFGDRTGGSDTVFIRSGEPMTSSDVGFRCVANATKPVN